MKMRAARIVEVGKIVCEEAEVRPPRDNELLVRNSFASICGSDLHVTMMGIGLPAFPQAPGFPGHEGIGEVVESRHQDFRPGDRVLTVPAPPQSFAFADYQTLSGSFCVKLPERGDSLQLLMAQQLGTVLFAIRQHAVDVRGKTVMVVGQGSAGMFFTRLMKRSGAKRIIVSDLSPARLALSRRMGADLAVLANGKSVRDAVMDLTDGQGVDYLIEAVGRRETLLQSVDFVRPGADMLLFGLPDSSEPVQFNYHDFFRKRIRAASIYGAQFEGDLASFRSAVDLILQGDVDVSPVVTHVLPIEQIHDAMSLAHERRDNAVKVSVRFSDGSR